MNVPYFFFFESFFSEMRKLSWKQIAETGAWSIEDEKQPLPGQGLCWMTLSVLTTINFGSAVRHWGVWRRSQRSVTPQSRSQCCYWSITRQCAAGNWYRPVDMIVWGRAMKDRSCRLFVWKWGSGFINIILEFGKPNFLEVCLSRLINKIARPVIINTLLK